MRESKLRLKADEIGKALDKWARRESILKIGERLVFSLRIEKVPIAGALRVSRDEAGENYLGMKPAEFFSVDRLLRAKATPRQATLTRFAIANADRHADGEKKPQDMRQFLECYSCTSKLRKIHNLGPVGLRLLVAALQSANLPVEDDIGILSEKKTQPEP